MSTNNKNHNRVFLGIIFDCCHVYSRIYLNNSKTAFVGFCPRCGKKVVLKVSANGSKDRFYRAI